MMVAVLATAATPAAADWRRYDTTHFIIYSEAPDVEVTRFATRLESMDGLMRLATGVAPNNDASKVRIYQVADENIIERALGAQGSGIAGYYTNNSLGPFAVTPRRIREEVSVNFTPDLVLYHEYAHHFMMQYSPSIYPSWYVEGFAELIGSSRFLPDGRIGYGMPAKHRGGNIAADWVPLQELLLKPPEKQYGLDLYGQGWALTHFLTFSKTRSPQLRTYLQALAAGKSPAEAARAFGDLGALNREAHLYVGAGSFPYTPVKVPLSGPVILSSSPVTAGEAALVPETIALDEGTLDDVRKPDERARLQKLRAANLSTIRTKAASYPNDPFAQRLLAEAEYTSGDLPRAEAAADRLLALSPNNVEGMARKSIILSARAGKLGAPERTAIARQARTLAVRANKLDTTNPIPVIAYYQSFRGAGEVAPEIAVQGLAAALEERPNNREIRHLLVDELEQRKRYAEAIGLLVSISNSPHDSPERAAARVQMARLQAASGMAVATPD